jgi:hypothetical protein
VSGAVEVFFDAYGKTGPTTDVLIDVMGYFEQSAGGAQGPAGPAGPAGPRGVTGDTGPRGPSDAYWFYQYNPTQLNATWTTVKTMNLPAGNYIVTATLPVSMTLQDATPNYLIQVNCLLQSPNVPGASLFSFPQTYPESYKTYLQEKTLTAGFRSMSQFSVEVVCGYLSDQDRPVAAYVSEFGITAIRVETLTEM